MVEVDIDLDPALKEEFGLLVPVVEVDGKVAFQGGESFEDLKDLLSDSL